ncbi:ABC transporter substrate-binding protein [Natrialbaceae archaeon A-CW2]
MNNSNSTHDGQSLYSRKRREFLSLFGAAGAIGFAGCIGGDDDNGATGGNGNGDDNVFNFGLGTGPDTLDLHAAGRVPEMVILDAVHDPLFRMNMETEPVPHIAEGYEESEDMTEFTFQLRDNITFHDGTELDGDIAVWNFERFIEQGGRFTYRLGDPDIEATGEYEVTMTFDSPQPFLINNLTTWGMGFVSRDAVEDAGDEYGVETVVGTGPFEFEEWVDGDYIRVTRYDDYNWGPEFSGNQGPANLDVIEFNIIPETTTLTQELLGGYIDGTKYVELADSEQVINHEDVEFHENSYPYAAWFPLNIEREPTDDIRVRQAINHAIDRDAIIEAALGGHATPIWGLAPHTSVDGLSEDRAQEIGYEYDLERARELLDEAGWTNSSEGEIREKDGESLEFEMLAFDLPQWAPQGEVAQALLAEVGIDVSLATVEGGTFYDRAENQEYHSVTAGVGAEFANNTVMRLLHSDSVATEGGTNYSMIQDDDLDELIEIANSEPDDEIRNDALQEAQEFAIEEALHVPIMTTNRVYAHKTHVSGVENFVDHNWFPEQYYLHHLNVDM